MCVIPDMQACVRPAACSQQGSGICRLIDLHAGNQIFSNVANLRIDKVIGGAVHDRGRPDALIWLHKSERQPCTAAVTLNSDIGIMKILKVLAKDTCCLSTVASGQAR